MKSMNVTTHLRRGLSVVCLLCLLLPASLLRAETSRVSVDSAEVQANASSDQAAISADGNFVAFASGATNLVAGDSNAWRDIFVRDLTNGTSERVSVSSAAAQSNGDSREPSLSQDGRYVVFRSNALNLVGGDSNNAYDIFVHDRLSHTTERVSLTSSQEQANGNSYEPIVSADGVKVVFRSSATDLLGAGVDTNARDDFFLRDRNAGSTTRLTVTSSAAQMTSGSCASPAISSDAEVIAFDCSDTNLGGAGLDTNSYRDVFVRDVQAGSTARVSHSTSFGACDGDSYRPSVSGDGRYIAFDSNATNLVVDDSNLRSDIFVYDRDSQIMTKITHGLDGAESNGDSIYPTFSSDGSFIAFFSKATNLTTDNLSFSGGYLIYQYEVASGSISLVQTSSSGVADNWFDLYGSRIAVSGDGSRVAFGTPGSNLIADDTNDVADIYLAADDCLSDSLKFFSGACGCGAVDADGDSDGTADCLDACPSDAAKAAAGVCGCGIADTDVSGNGAIDCLDPAAATVPTAPAVNAKKKAKIKVTMQNFSGSGVRYNLFLKKGSKIVYRKENLTSNVYTIRNFAKGSYRAFYEVRYAGVRTQLSPSSAKFKAK
jgi:Tol biopolymer transport system component